MSDRTEILRQHMKLVDIASFQALSEQTGLSRRAIDTLRKGNASTLKYTELAQLARILQLELQELIAKFINPIDSSDKNASTISTISPFHQEYQRLQQKLENQQQELRSQFERETIQQLESLLLQLPSAAYAAQNNPNMLAKDILPLFKPLDVLLQKWGITVIGFVGEEIAYDPQKHQLIEGNDEVEIGNPAIVRYIGYTKGEILLYRARVSAKPH